jgi:hypothetical protein
VLAEPAELPAQVARTGRVGGRTSLWCVFSPARVHHERPPKGIHHSSETARAPHRTALATSPRVAQSQQGGPQRGERPSRLLRCAGFHLRSTERGKERERERSPLARAFGAPGQANAGGLAGGAAVSVRPVAGDAADGTAPAAAEEGEEHWCLLLDLLCDGSLARFLRECLASGWTHGSCGLLAFGDLSALKS